MTELTIIKAKHGGYTVWAFGPPRPEQRGIEGALFAGSLDECLCFIRREMDPAISSDYSNALKFDAQ